MPHENDIGIGIIIQCQFTVRVGVPLEMVQRRAVNKGDPFAVDLRADDLRPCFDKFHLIRTDRCHCPAQLIDRLMFFRDREFSPQHGVVVALDADGADLLQPADHRTAFWVIGYTVPQKDQAVRPVFRGGSQKCLKKGHIPVNIRKNA